MKSRSILLTVAAFLALAIGVAVWILNKFANDLVADPKIVSIFTPVISAFLSFIGIAVALKYNPLRVDLQKRQFDAIISLSEVVCKHRMAHGKFLSSPSTGGSDSDIKKRLSASEESLKRARDAMDVHSTFVSVKLLLPTDVTVAFVRFMGVCTDIQETGKGDYLAHFTNFESTCQKYFRSLHA